MPSCTALFVDRLAMTFSLTDTGARDAIEEWMCYGGDEILGYRASTTRGGRYYAHSKMITFDAEREVTLLIEYSPNSRRVGQRSLDAAPDAEAEPDLDVFAWQGRRPLRIEFNPARLLEVPEHHQAFLQIMNLWFGRALHAEVAGAQITRIDLATDVLGMDINSLLVARIDSTCVSTTYSRDGSIQTMYLGSKNSRERFVLYDKREQRALAEPARRLRRPLTRIEVRLKSSLSLQELRCLANPFHALGVRHIDNMLVMSGGNSPHYWQWMIAAAKQDGLEATLAKIRNPKTRKVWRDRAFQKDEPAWWSPDELWRGLNAALDAVGIFSVERRVRRVRRIRE